MERNIKQTGKNDILNQFDIQKYNINRIKLIFEFLDLKELISLLRVSVLFSKICWSFDILKKLISVTVPLNYLVVKRSWNDHKFYFREWS